jgi:sporulation protein YlmC with PRC-barrel domain
MLKKHMAACLVVTAFAAAPALAQTSTSPSAPTDRPAASGSGTTSTGSPAMQPSSGGSSTMGQSSTGQSSTTMGQNSAAAGQFMTQMQSNQIMASDLIGTRVVSANNESIGDVNDVLLDRNGQVMAAVVGVGGFLGIGEKNVAVPFNSLEFMSAQQAQALDSSKNGNNVNATGSTATGNTASTGTGSAASNNTTTSSSDQNQPERVVLRMTKAELQAAPTFDKKGNNNASRSTTGATGTSGTTGNSTAPQQ